MRRLRCAAFAAVTVLGFASAASAAAPVWNWTGFYVGGNVGYGWGRSDAHLTITDTGNTFSFTQSDTLHIDGVIGGGGIGYNWQYMNWVFGLEADIQGSGQKGDATFICPAGVCSTPPVTTTVTEKLNWFGTVRPRLGWTVTPNIMLYATGGLAYGQITESGTITNGTASTTFDAHKTSAGWTLGGGVEGQLVGNWTWRVEYLFLELKEPTVNVVTSIPGPGRLPPPDVVQIDPLFRDNIVRAGINYKF